ncbi:MAG: hypothetical protein BTN85_0814 [Candidatus Methanohalarchaeum thermophilum]|uniref:Uncharacterized protein n=1 Tax=Methanohalarchaeum thermophilum TaxID=1903181 RepID=A0A1Q6DVE2_METT1|nr:MAG: hypothetical protein BTN85_0814 [Candidatus Methanohalarchaeum thermophilum]
MDLTLSGVYRIVQRLKKRDLVERIGNSKPAQYRVLPDNIPINLEGSPGVQPSPQSPLLEIHGSLIKFCNLSHVYGQLDSNRGKLGGLKFFREVDDSPYNREDFLFRFGDWLIRFTTRSALLKKLPDNRFRCPVDFDGAFEVGDGIVFPYEEKEREALERAREDFLFFLKRLRAESNGSLKIGDLTEIEFSGWTQKRHFSLNYGEDRVGLDEVDRGLKVVVDDFPDAWMDESPLKGEKCEVEGYKTLAEDLGLVRSLRSKGGLVGKEDLDEAIEVIKEEAREANEKGDGKDGGNELLSKVERIEDSVKRLAENQDKLVNVIEKVSSKKEEDVSDGGSGKVSGGDRVYGPEVA